MSEQWDGKVVMSTPGGPIVEMSLGDLLARKDAEIERLRADLATQQGCCDGAAAQDAHIRREREEHKAEVEKLRAEIERLRAERDTLLLDAREFVRWFNRHYPDPSRDPSHPWCAINNRLNANADTLETLDAALGLRDALHHAAKLEGKP